MKAATPANSITPATSGPGITSYTVVSGDSLSAIAYKLYGNANAWPTIYNASIGVLGGNPALIYPGQVLTIPTLQQSGSGPAPVGAVGGYVVIEGDSLSLIALKVWGDANRWPELYQSNRSTIGNNPDCIFPGQILGIPLGQ